MIFLSKLIFWHVYKTQIIQYGFEDEDMRFVQKLLIKIGVLLIVKYLKAITFILYVIIFVKPVESHTRLNSSGYEEVIITSPL